MLESYYMLSIFTSNFAWLRSFATVSFIQVSDSDQYLQCTFLSTAALKAGALIAGWMEDAGLRTWESFCITMYHFFLRYILICLILIIVRIFRWVDQMGNIHGHIDGKNANEPALLIGSHLVDLNNKHAKGLILNYNFQIPISLTKPLQSVTGHGDWCWNVWWILGNCLCHCCYKGSEIARKIGTSSSSYRGKVLVPYFYFNISFDVSFKCNNMEACKIVIISIFVSVVSIA